MVDYVQNYNIEGYMKKYDKAVVKAEAEGKKLNLAVKNIKLNSR